MSGKMGKSIPEIRLLPSGWYSVWLDGVWVDAALPDRSAAERFLQDLLQKLAKKTNSRRK